MSGLNFYFPVDENGINPEIQSNIWKSIFFTEGIYPPHFDLICTKTHALGDASYAQSWSEIIFECFGFQSSLHVTDAYAAMKGFSFESLIPFTNNRLNENQDNKNVEKNEMNTFLGINTNNHENIYNRSTNMSQYILNISGTACIVDLGFRSTRIIPIINHQIQYQAIKEFNTGGRFFTSELQNIISNRYFDFSKEWWIANYIKEECLLCSMNYKEDIMKAAQSQENKFYYQLPNIDEVKEGSEMGNVGYVVSKCKQPSLMNLSNNSNENNTFDPNQITWNNLSKEATLLTLLPERYMIPELLFKANSKIKVRIGSSANQWRTFSNIHPINSIRVSSAIEWEKSQFNLASGIVDCICNQGFSQDDQNNLLNSIVLCGGSSKISGLSQRLQNEMSSLIGHPIIIPNVDKKETLIWNGAASMDREFMSDLRILKSDYYEYGPSIMQRKGFQPIY